MADLLTVYDDEQVFVECPICDKKIIGETILRIHQTTMPHLKREEALAAEGLIPWPARLPEWTDIIHYLKYLDLDEPIIGLSELVQTESYMTDDCKVMLRYKCQLCSVEMDMTTMATHLVGRKHRQKYVERKRPDLVSWNVNAQKAPALVVRAKAAVVEKIEGWGKPLPLYKIKTQMNYQERRSGPARQNEFSGRNTSGQSEDFYGQSSSRDDSYRKSLPSLFDCRFDEPFKNKDVQQRPNRNEERYSTLNSDDERQHQLRQNDYLSDQPRFEGLNMASYQENNPAAPRSRHDDYQDEYTAMGSSRSLYSARDQQESFNQGGVLRSRFADSGSALRPEEMAYWENEGMQNQMFPSRQGRTAARPQPEDRMGRSDSFGMQDNRKRYLPNKDDNPGKKKQKKSRFSDASPQEIARARLSQVEDMVSRNERNRPVSSRTHESGMKMGTDGKQFTPKMENALNVLSDIQIENVEEANFLKDKLCTLLKEFQSNKVQRTQQRNSNVTEFRNTGQPLMEQYKDMLQPRRSEDKNIPPFGKHDQDLRRQDSRPFQGDFGYAPDERRRNEKNTFQASTQYKSGFPKSGSFEKVSTGFPEKRGLGNDTRDYAGTRQFEQNLLAFQQRGQFQNEARDYQHMGRSDMDSENVKQNMSRDEGRHYSDYGKPSQSHTMPLRGAGDERYGVGKSDYQREPEWNSNRDGSSGQFDRMPYYPEDERRGYEENIWKPRSIENDGGYGEAQSHDFRSGAELYDPFQAQPPNRDMGHSSIDKLASTLLELVARKSH